MKWGTWPQLLVPPKFAQEHQARHQNLLVATRVPVPHPVSSEPQAPHLRFPGPPSAPGILAQGPWMSHASLWQ